MLAKPLMQLHQQQGAFDGSGHVWEAAQQHCYTKAPSVSNCCISVPLLSCHSCSYHGRGLGHMSLL